MIDLVAKACANAECRLGLFAEKRRRDHAKRAILIEDARRLRDQRAEAAGIENPGSYALIVIPSFAAPVTKLPERRRRALRAWLMRLIRAAAVSRRDAPASLPALAKPTAPKTALQSVIGQACAQCRGSCCRGGGDHAYLSIDVVRRFMHAHPNLRPREVLAIYLDRLSNNTYEDSCAYHGLHGCGLSAEMRSDTCNHFFCEGLKDLLRSEANAESVRAFLASEHDGAIQATRFAAEPPI